MRSLVPQREKYLINFANLMYDEFLKLKYGITSCRKKGEAYVDELRKEIVEYQVNNDGGALCEVSITYMGWLPVYYPSEDISCEYQSPWCNNSYQIQRCSKGPSAIGLSYVGQNNSLNLIEVNAGGCITKINVNPSIVINNNAIGFTYNQPCNTPQTVWNINHNLGYTPNVWAEDCNGTNISGTISVIDNNTITLTFSTAVAGKAHLS